jgi:DNA-binding NtrC family response regulator
MTQTVANTVRDEDTERRAPLRTTLVHVASYDELLRAPRGIFEIPERCVVGREGKPTASGGFGLEDERASEKHLELTRDGEVVKVRDLGSRNGTLLNGRLLEQEERLRDGDLLELGRSVLLFREVLEAAPLPARGGKWCEERTFSPKLAALSEQLTRIARSQETVLLLGETGVGKELAARFVHAQSKRPGLLVPVDCGAMPEALFESALFGDGAQKEGEVRRAEHGTLFLDEVGNLPLATQGKLLRVLETREVRGTGSAQARAVDVRFVAATNASLSDENAFRSDLRFRLAGFVGRVPPLRARREDLGLLMATFLKEAGVKHASLSRAAAARLFHHAWPGNVRQLRSVLRAAVFLNHAPAELLIDTPVLEELDERSLSAGELEAPLRASQPPRETLEGALRTAQGRVTVAARSLGTSPRQLYRWLERFELDPDVFRLR